MLEGATLVIHKPFHKGATRDVTFTCGCRVQWEGASGAILWGAACGAHDDPRRRAQRAEDMAAYLRWRDSLPEARMGAMFLTPETRTHAEALEAATEAAAQARKDER